MSDYQERSLALRAENNKLLAEQNDLLRKMLAGTSGNRPAPAPARPSPAPAAAGDGPTNFPNYGRSKGQPVRGATMQDLEYYANGARKSLADPAKARWHDKERELLAAIEAEIERQGGGAPPARRNVADYPPPPRGFDDPEAGGARGTQDEDIPFATIETRIDRA